MHNQIIIEASAGCGKTYRIEEILLSLIEEGLELSEIVIVTFTQAQAKDLKKRIYNRLKKTKSNKAQRSLKLFDEANISTLHSFSQKVIQEAGVLIDFHAEEITTFANFKKSFKSILRHEIPESVVNDAQLEKVCIAPSSIKNIRNQFGKKIEVTPLSKSIEQLKSARLSIPYSYEEVLKDYETLTKFYKKKKGSETIPQFLELFKEQEWGEKELCTLVKTGFEWDNLFNEDNRRQKCPDIEAPPLEKYFCLGAHLKPIVNEISSRENIEKAIAKYCQEERHKLHKEIVVFDDLIRVMDEESEKPEFIRFFKSRYKVAIIDEFQDTDAVQWRIFKRLFDRFYIVGDPKQAIYGFRDADIYTYLEAYHSITERQTLDTNWRSSPSLIKKLNNLFLSAPAVFKLPKLETSLPYPIVKAGKDIEGGKLVVVESEKIRDLYPFITHLVAENPSEWAILVRGHKQADKIASVLSDCQIPYLIQRQYSMAQSDAGKSLYQILEAISSKKRIRGALASSLINYSAEELFRLDDYTEFEAQVLRFQKYGEALEKGFAHFVDAFEEDFIHRITNSPPLFYEWEALLEEIFSWLQKNELKDFFEGAIDNEEKRFVGTEQGVKIMTIHASKGLEFDKVIVLGAVETNTFLDKEEEAELMRLFYVALTRAKKELYVPVLFDKRNMMNLFLNHVKEGFTKENLAAWVKEIDADYQKIIPDLEFKKRALPQFETMVPLKRVFSPIFVSSYTRLKEKREAAHDSPESLLPKGVEMGLCLHNLLEKTTFQTPIEISLKHSPFEMYEKEISLLLTNLMEQVEIGGVKLKDLKSYRQMREVPFTYKTENGFMTGIIDLVIEVDQDIYIVDWKSHSLVDYSAETLKKVVFEESFDLQARLYYEAGRKAFGKVKEVLFVFIRGPGVYRWIP